MSNLSDIVNIAIELNQPVIDGASFDNLLIVGPGPKQSGKVQPNDVGVYATIDEVIECGWNTTGVEADPVGMAALVAFSQSPAPSNVYIAVQKPSERAVAAQAVIQAANTAIETYVGTKKDLTGCTLVFQEDARRVLVTLTAVASKVKNTGLFDMLEALTVDGYMVHVDGIEISNLATFQALPYYESIMEMRSGSEAVEFAAVVSNQDGACVSYNVVVAYPEKGTAELGEIVREPLDSPEIELESVIDTLNRAASEDGWYVSCPAGIDENEYEGIAQWTEAHTKLFFFPFVNHEKIPVGSIYYRSAGIFCKETSEQEIAEIPEANHYLHVAYAAKCLNYKAGSETWAFKTLSGVYPSSLTSSVEKQLEEAHMNWFTTVAGKNITRNGQVAAGEWIDIIRFRDWLQNDMQIRILNLFIKNPKVLYTDSGIALVQNQMIASLKEGQNIGGIAEDEYDEEETLIPGYKTSVPRAASLTDSQRASRKLTNCKFSARLAGAIHAVEINGALVYSY